ncbi:MAG: phosphate acyltransferase PlsX [Gemmatimonadetes bacterium]|nr:phosphate acyltransferase PlsX [Gemmatimonadota bacterium]
MIRVALDVLGGDAAPETPLAGARAALEAWSDEVSLALVGPEGPIRSLLGEFPPENVSWLPAEDRIDVADPPALAVRRKPDSTIVRGLQAVRDGQVDAFVSAGSTGALMVGSVLTLGVLPGVDRPPVAALFPTATGRVLVLDVGANIHVRPHHLHQFAHLGSIYLRDRFGTERPRVALLNMGEEEEKGGDVSIAAHGLLSGDDGIEFVGNIEGHQIITGDCDVIVCGGFVGNVLLKFYESISGFILGIFEESGLGSGGDLNAVLKFLDYTEYGGAPLLGVNGVTIICHGASPARAIKNAIRTAIDTVRSNALEDMRVTLESLDAMGVEP